MNKFVIYSSKSNDCVKTSFEILPFTNLKPIKNGPGWVVRTTTTPDPSTPPSPLSLCVSPAAIGIQSQGKKGTIFHPHSHRTHSTVHSHLSHPSFPSSTIFFFFSLLISRQRCSFCFLFSFIHATFVSCSTSKST